MLRHIYKLFPLWKLKKTWYHFSKHETQCALLLICFALARTKFTAQLFYHGQSRDEVWVHHRFFNFLIVGEIELPETLIAILLGDDGKFYNGNDDGETDDEALETCLPEFLESFEEVLIDEVFY